MFEDAFDKEIAPAQPEDGQKLPAEMSNWDGSASGTMLSRVFAPCRAGLSRRLFGQILHPALVDAPRPTPERVAASFSVCQPKRTPCDLAEVRPHGLPSHYF